MPQSCHPPIDCFVLLKFGISNLLNACSVPVPGPLFPVPHLLRHGARAGKARTVSARIEWVERFRTSSKTRQRHELSGFIGECTYEFPDLESGISNPELLQWLALGELVHVGRHTPWGNGWFELAGDPE